MTTVQLTLESLHVQSRPVNVDISVVIPTLGRPILESSLCYIAIGTAWPAAVIIVDQGRSSEVAGLADRFRELGLEVTYIASSQKGRSAGINRGLEALSTPFVCITDDDCFVDENWVSNMSQALSENPNSIISGKVLSGDETVVMSATSNVRASYDRPRLSFDRLSGGNMGTSAKVIDRVGMFDESESVRTAEDGEWAYRALRSGVTLIYEPNVVVTHYAWRDSEGRQDQYKRYARSHGGFYGKYLRRGDLFIAARVVFHLLRALKTTTRGILKGNRELRTVGWAYFTGLIPGIVAGMSDSSGAGNG